MANQITVSCGTCSYCHNGKCASAFECYGRYFERSYIAHKSSSTKSITNEEWLESLGELEKMVVLINFVRNVNIDNPDDVINAYHTWLANEHISLGC